MKTFNYALVMMLLVILSCQKEDLTPLPEESLSGNQTVSFRSTSIADRDADLVNAFYTDLLALQDRTGFYDDFYEEYGYIAWSKTIEYITQGTGKILAVPVQSPNGGAANGVFLYYSTGSDKRIQFIDRTEVETKINANAFSEISKDEEFAYRNFLLTDLKSGIATENLSPPDMDVFFGGEGEDSSCQGGSFEHICVYITGGLEGLDARTLVGDYMDENYGVYGTIDDQFDGFTIDELTTYLQSEGYNNTGPSGISSEDYLELQRYYNDRLALYLATGIGGDISGVLSGYRPAIDLEVECFDVWVWCWQDPADFGIMIGGGGGGGVNQDFLPTWQEEYDRLRFCEGVNDIFDTGPDNPSQLHPDYDFCAIWMAYLEDCILPNQPGFNEFEAISSYEGLILTWAEFQYNNPELFTAVIADPADCTPTNELEDYTPEDENLIDEECRNALLDFLATYGITMTKAERLAILTSGGNPECTDQEAFEEWVIQYLVDEDLQSGSTIVETNGDEVTEVTNSILPYSCSSFIIEDTHIPGRYRSQITWWEPSITTFSLIPFGYRHYDYRLSVEIFFTPLPGEPECEVKNILASAFNDASTEAVRLFAGARQYLLPEDAAEVELEELMEIYLTSYLEPHFPLSLPEVLVPAIVELDGYPLIPRFPGEEEDCCE